MDLQEVKTIFLTGSKFAGYFQPDLHEMEQNGVYIYPDETRYKGQFYNGKFHGMGKISMPPPCSFTFVGQFENGSLVRLDDMIFGDDLRFNQFDGKTLDLETWAYCTGDERRYASELKQGIWPVGARKAKISIRHPPRQLGKAQYDLEEGVYNAETGFVSRIPPPFEHTRYIPCAADRDWIKRYCRSGNDPFEESPIHKIGVPIHDDCPRILQNNLEAAQIEAHENQLCICQDLINRKRYFGNFTEKFMAEVKSEAEHEAREDDSENKRYDDINDVYSQSTIESEDSFNVPSTLEMLNKANMQLNIQISKARSAYALHTMDSEKSNQHLLKHTSTQLLAPNKRKSERVDFSVDE